MKKILILFGLAVLIGCTKEEGNSSVSAPSYMIRLADKPGWGAKNSFVNFTVNEKVYDRTYEVGMGDLLLCSSHVGNLSPVGRGSESVGVRFGAPMNDYKAYFPNLPIVVGGMWTVGNSEMVVIEEIDTRALNVKLSLPKSFEEKVLIGDYRIAKGIYEDGFRLGFDFGLSGKLASGDRIQGGYEITLDPTRKRKVEITRVERIVGKGIRITANFSGFFVGKDLNKLQGPVVYETYITGSFSYIIGID